MWTQADAIALCVAIEDVCPKFGCHVALTGGLLYKSGPRKDADILFYRIRDVAEIDISGLLCVLQELGITHDYERDDEYGDELWCVKAMYHGRPIDLFFPEICAPCRASGPGIDVL